MLIQSFVSKKVCVTLPSNICIEYPRLIIYRILCFSQSKSTEYIDYTTVCLSKLSKHRTCLYATGDESTALSLCMSMEEHFEPAETCMVLVARPTWPPIYRYSHNRKRKGANSTWQAPLQRGL